MKTSTPPRPSRPLAFRWLSRRLLAFGLLAILLPLLLATSVRAQNVQPTMTALTDDTIFENTGGGGTLTKSLNGITRGPNPAENAQTLTITATSSNPGLIPTPVVSWGGFNNVGVTTGFLSYIPVPNASGTALITVTLTDNGGTAGGGVDTLVRTYTITVNAVNAPPTLNPIPTPAAINKSATPTLQTVNLAGITAGPGETQVLSVSVTSSNTGLIPTPTVSYTSASATGSLSYTPVATPAARPSSR